MYIHTSHLDKFQVSMRIPISPNSTWVYSSGHFGWILVEIVWVNSRGNFLGEFSWTKCPRKFLYLGEFSWTKNVHENSWKMSTRIHPLKISTRTPSFWKKVSTRIHFPREFSIPYFLSFIFNKFFSTSKIVQGVLILKLCIYFILKMVLFFDSIKVEFSRGLEIKRYD